jgi:hypothetical protein
MVSSYIIQTSIQIPKRFIKEFNERPVASSVKFTTPDFFDSSRLSLTLPRENPDMVSAHYVDGWVVDDSGVLSTDKEKFHGAVKSLYYLIDTWFKPRGITLNGTVMGFNREFPHCYCYKVVDNVIMLLVDPTLDCLQRLNARHERDDLADMDSFYDVLFRTYLNHTTNLERPLWTHKSRSSR